MGNTEDLLYGVLKIKQPDGKEGLRVNMDTILLAAFTKPRRQEKIMEIGCAHGAVSLILAKRGFNVEGIDIQHGLIELAKENARINGLEENVKFYAADVRDYRKIWRAQSFDRIVVNPPYDELSSSNRSPSDGRAKAAHGLECTLVSIVEASKYLLKNKGRLDMVIRAGRAAELFSLLDRNGLVPKVLRCVHPKPGRDAVIVLVEAMRAASHGIVVKPPLFVLDEAGRDTPELLEAYRISEGE